MTFYMRPAREDDVDQLLELARQTGFGLTTLPPKRKLLLRRVIGSIQAFQQLVKEPAGQSYLLVLEDLDSGKVLGTSGMDSKVGGFEPFYAFQLEQETFESESLGVRRDLDVLRLVANHNGPGEIGSLFLDPSCQKKGLGGLLSRSRFLFMAEHPKLFEEEIVAEMRGSVDDRGNSHFWDAIGSHFFGMDFPKADYLSVRSKKFIADLMPRHPIYVPMLPEAAQKIIGQVHRNTLPALKMLQKEGFELTGMVDIFEAGPVVSCARDKIRTVQRSRRAKLTQVEEIDGAPFSLVANTSQKNFRACLSPCALHENGEVVLPETTARVLGVETGESIRFVTREAL